jgi:hypothetical protein
MNAYNTAPAALAVGGTGGAGGGGLVILCRGLNFGVNGKIILSGADGSAGTALAKPFAYSAYGGPVTSGSGAGGASGYLAVMLDGKNLTYPDLTATHFIANTGATPEPAGTKTGGLNTYFDNGVTRASSYVGQTRFEGDSFYAPASGSGLTEWQRVTYLEGSQTAVADPKLIADVPTAVGTSTATNTPQTPAQNLATVTVTVTPPSDGNYLYSNVYYRITGTTPWTLAGPANNTRTIVAAMDGNSYDFEARSVSRLNGESPTGARTTAVISTGAGGVNLASGNYILAGQTAYDTGTGFYMGNDSGTPKMSMGNSAGNKWTWNGTVLSIVGSVTATTGAIGGWTLGATALTAGSGATTVGLDSGGTNPAVYAGSATPGSAPFRVTQAGALTATSGAVGGWTLGTTSFVSGSGATTVGLDSGGTNPALYAGSATPGSAPFRVTQAGAVTATNATITGAITATSGSFTGTVTATSGAIGGWTLAATTLTGGGLVLDSSNTRLRATSGSSYVELSATSLKGYSNTLGRTTFEVKADGSSPTFSDAHITYVTSQDMSAYSSGTHLTVAASAADTTLTVQDTTAFGASGTGWIVDSTNTNDIFTWTGKTSTTLTGCSGVLAHNAGAIIIPGKSFVQSAATDETSWHGTNGVMYGSIGVNTNPYSGDSVIASFGNFNSGGYASTYIGVQGLSYDNTGVYGKSTDYIGTAGFSTNLYGVYASSVNSYSAYLVSPDPSLGKAPLRIVPASSSSAPTHSADIGALWVTSAGVLYINTSGSTTWTKVGAQ